jgi:hypothetical protein
VGAPSWPPQAGSASAATARIASRIRIPLESASPRELMAPAWAGILAES